MIYPYNTKTGWIEVVTGPMFSGKSEELIRRLKRAEIARQRIMVFKPEIDDRYDAKDIVSHDKQRFNATPIKDAEEIFDLIKTEVNVVAIDEAQFFDSNLVDVCEALADRGIRVIAAGLDQDYRGKPFSPMDQLLAVAESITKLQAVCVKCGAPATRSQLLRKKENEEEHLVGGQELYEARCRACFERIEENYDEH